MHANAHALSCLSCGDGGKLPASLQTVERFSLRSGYLNLSQWAGYQRSGRFDDTYWRPAERQGQIGFGLELPGVLRWNGRTGLIAAEASYNALVEPDATGGARYDAGAHLRVFDVDDRHRHSSFRGRILGVELRKFATPTSLDSSTTEHRPTDVRLYILDTEGITFDQGRHTFGFAWGKRTLKPAQAPPQAGQDGGPKSSVATDLQFRFTRPGAGRCPGRTRGHAPAARPRRIGGIPLARRAHRRGTLGLGRALRQVRTRHAFCWALRPKKHLQSNGRQRGTHDEDLLENDHARRAPH